MSKVVTLSADENSATVEDATVGDILSTALATDKALTGAYGLVQKGGLVVAGMAINSFRLRGSINPFVKAEPTF